MDLSLRSLRAGIWAHGFKTILLSVLTCASISLLNAQQPDASANRAHPVDTKSSLRPTNRW
jgi:hypothetical protein